MPVTSALLEMLENVGLVAGQRIDERFVRRLSASRIVDLGAEAEEVTRVDQVDLRPGEIAHTATISLSGGTDPCSGIDCRIRHIDGLIPFAALYSDRVFIHNFLIDHQHPGHSYVPTLNDRRQTLLDDLRIITRVRPLIEAGLLVPVAPAGDRCPQCLARTTFGPGADRRLEVERQRLARRFFESMKVSFEYDDGFWGIHCVAPEELLEHGNRYFALTEVPEALRDKPRLLKRAVNGEIVKLGRAVRRRLGYHSDAARDVLATVGFEMAVAQVLGTAYLSDTVLPLQILTAISGDPDLARRSSLIQRHLTSIVPFVGDLSPAAVLKLRQREPEAFLLFRNALAAAVDEVRSQKSSFSERDARSIYTDVVAPKLAGVDRAVTSARREALRDVARSVFGWTAAISFGVYSGLLPTELATVAKSLGLTKVVADLGAGATRILAPNTAVEREEFYFLWKVRKLVGSRSQN